MIANLKNFTDSGEQSS